MTSSKGKSEVAVYSPQQLATIENLNTLVERVFPESGQDGLGIIQGILDADLRDLVGEDDNNITDVESLYGHMLRIDKVPSRVESEYKDSPGTFTPWYLYIEAYDLDANTEVATTLSGLSVMVKIARLVDAMVLPAVVRFSESKTRSGYDVQNCSVISITERETIDA